MAKKLKSNGVLLIAIMISFQSLYFTLEVIVGIIERGIDMARAVVVGDFFCSFFDQPKFQHWLYQFGGWVSVKPVTANRIAKTSKKKLQKRCKTFHSHKVSMQLRLDKLKSLLHYHLFQLNQPI